MVENQRIYEILLTPHSVLSLKDSSSEEHALTDFFENRLKTLYEYEDSPEERLLKDQAFLELKQIIQSWLSEVAASSEISSLPTKDSAYSLKTVKNRISAENPNSSGNLLIFGSFRMQVNHKESDLDTICIVPSFVSRDAHFFGLLLQTLKSHAKVSDIYPISDAMVPLIKLKFSTIPVDILFARLELPEIPANLSDFSANDDILLRNIDEKSYKSLNGIRTADLILKSVKNIKEYRVFLRLVKLWAKNKLIYSSVMGYLGGISYAILCAKICQLYPNFSVSRLLERFFFIYSLWIWEEMPVLIEKMWTNTENSPNSKLLQFQWDEKAEKTEMSIITPAFPCMNSSHTVSITTGQIIRKMLRKGYRTIRGIKDAKDWDSLFEKVRFFEKYTRFVEISIVARKNQEDFLIWKGHYESRLRKFLRIIEGLKLHKIVTFHLNPTGFERKDAEFPFCVSFYIGVKITEENAQHAKLLRLKEVDLDSVVKSFLDSAVESHQFIPEYMNTRIRIVKREEIEAGIAGKGKEKAKKLFLKEKIDKIL